MANDVISKRKFERDGFTVIVSRVADYDADVSYLTQEYEGVSPEEQARYQAEDAARLRAYHDGEWSMIGITVDVKKQTASNWADGGLTVGRASCWGFESDMDEGDLVSEEANIVDEAFAEVERLKTALCGSREQ